MAIDRNGLHLSNQTNSGYKYVTTFFDGPYVGKFVAFADLTNDRMRELNRDFGDRYPGLNDSHVVILGMYDDVRDAAHVAQTFQGEGTTDRNSNLLNLFDGRRETLSTPPEEWKHDPDQERMEAAKKRSEGNASNRAGKLTIQSALAKFHSNHALEYKISGKQAPVIRKAMAEYIEALEQPPTNADLLAAAEEAFRPYRKG